MATLSSHLLNSVNGTHANNVDIIIYQIKSNGKKELGEGIIIVFAIKDGKVGLAVGVTDNLISKFDAVKFVKLGSETIGGKGGGGRKDFAQAGGQNQSKIEEAFEKIKTLI